MATFPLASLARSALRYRVNVDPNPVTLCASLLAQPQDFCLHGGGPACIQPVHPPGVGRGRPMVGATGAGGHAGTRKGSPKGQRGVELTAAQQRQLESAAVPEGLSGLFTASPLSRPVTLSWCLSLYANELQAGGGEGGKAMTAGMVQKPILEDVSGRVKSGQMMALMGASGAGKSSLLDCISLRNQKFRGQVFVDDQPAGADYFGRTAYVYQDDLFFPTLTVREHLQFHAAVRMPERVAHHTKMEKVDHIITDVGLQSCADTLLGGPTSFIRGVSGGERKRVAVATELLSNPAIMFLDEPTSGLDSFMAEAVCGLLRKLADAGRIVVCVIHQPSSDTFNLFTHLCLLAKGRTAYLGELSHAVDYFRSIGHPCPPAFNPADFFIEELAVIPSDYDKSIARLRVITDAYAKSELRRSNDAWLQGMDMEELRSTDRKRSLVTISNFATTPSTQFWENFRRTLIQYKREPVLTRARLVNSMLMGLLLGAVYFQQPNTYHAVQNKLGVLFIITINQTISSLFGVVQEIPRDFSVFMREYLAGANRVGAYFGARTLAELPFQLLFPAVFGSIVYGMVGLRQEGQAYLVYLLVIVLCGNSAVSLGYALSAIFGTTNVAIAAGAVVLMPMALFSGLLLDMAGLNPALSWFQWLSIIRYAYHALVINEFHGLRIYCGFNALCPFRSGSEVMDYVGASPHALLRDVGLLFVLMCGFRLVAFQALRFHSQRLTGCASG